MMSRRPHTYADAGVDLRAAEELTGRLAELVAETHTGAVRGRFGSFGGRFQLREGSELVASADGVGTKVLVACRAGRHDTVGEDLVNHCVNDILTEGAEPLFFLDYYACGRLVPDVAYAVIEGVARGCRRNGCVLLGGETAEMPGLYAPDEYDLAGFIVGRIAFDVPGAAGVREGDLLVGLPSDGLHTNGYSLARRILFEQLRLAPGDAYPGCEGTVADVLLRVHRSYLPILRDACAAGYVTALAHITGGGIPGNLKRVLPAACDAVIDLGAWEPGPEFGTLARESGLGGSDLFEALNMGIGMIAVVSPESLDAAVRTISAAGGQPFVCGEVRAGRGEVVLEGQ